MFQFFACSYKKASSGNGVLFFFSLTLLCTVQNNQFCIKFIGGEKTFFSSNVSPLHQTQTIKIGHEFLIYFNV